MLVLVVVVVVVLVVVIVIAVVVVAMVVTYCSCPLRTLGHPWSTELSAPTGDAGCGSWRSGVEFSGGKY